MKKSLLTLSVLLATASVQAQTFGGGDGSSQSPYLISTKAHLTELATAVGDGNTFENKCFRLENNLTYTSSESFPMIGYTGKVTPKKFNGTFDGNGKTISGGTLNGTYYVSLFAFIDTKGSVKNLTLDNLKITSTNSYGGALAGQSQGDIDNCHASNIDLTTTVGSYKGGLVGFLKGATLSNCHVSGSFTTAVSFGGIVGQNYGHISKSYCDATIVAQSESGSSVHIGGIASVSLTLSDASKISDCYFIGSIQGSSLNNCGGISSTLNVGEIERCWNGGYISGSGNLGGIVATLNAGTISDCYNAGTVYNIASTAGGIAGFVKNTNNKELKIKNCYNSGSMFVPVIKRNAGCELIGDADIAYNEYLENCFYDRQTSGFFDSDLGLSTSSMTSGNALTGYDAATWTFTAGLYPRLKTSADTEAALLFSTPFTLADGENHDRVKTSFTVSTANDVEWEVRGGTASINGNNVTVQRSATIQNLVLTSYLGNLERRSLVSVYPQIFTGAGTESDPYILATKEDILKFCDAMNNQQMDFTGEYLRMTSDIDIEHDGSFLPFGFSTTALLAFNGTFDGNGHSLKNISIDSRTNKVMNVGLFPTIGALGIVKNLTLDNSCQFLVFRNFAPFTANLYGTLENCRNYADVPTTEGYSAGCAGFIYESGKVKGCFNAGSISATTRNGALGGIFISNNGGLVENCLNTGTITADSFDKAQNLGGIGYSNHGTLRNVMNTGLVKGGANSSIIGGIVATDNAQSLIENALSVAPVIAGGIDNVGSIVGSPKGTYKNSYADIQITLHADGLDGVSLVNTNVLTAYDWKGLGTEAWSYTPGRYPVLASMADEPNAQLGSMPVILGDGMSRNQISGDGILYQANGLTWSLKEGGALSINGNKLVYSAPQAYTKDVLTATFNGRTKEIPLGAMAVLFSGKGSEDDPYIISTADDLVKLSDDIAASGVGYAGKFFRVSKDIDMSSVANFTPIAQNAKFGATFDGDGHTIDNLTISSTTTPAGLFYNVGATAKICNLTIGAKSKITGKGSTGAFASNLEGTLHNCTNKATVSTTATIAGGLVGTAKGQAVLSDLVNEASMTSSQTKTAGIVGAITSLGVKGSNLVNRGDITSTANNAAGIVSHATGFELNGAENYGVITGRNDVAGLVGQSSDILIIENGYNYGKISGATEVGGIAGYTSKAGSKIIGCMNAANVEANTQAAAGILARGVAVTISQCANFGDITNTKTSLSTSNAGAAAIVAKADPTIEDCYNFGTISAWDNVGSALGIYNSTTAQTSVKNFYNAGNVTATGTTPAGAAIFIGKGSTSKKPILTNCVYDKQVLHDATDDGGLSTSALLATSFGENFSDGTNGYPILNCLAEIPVARLHRTAVSLGEGEHFGMVKNGFSILTDPEVSLSGDDVFTVSGNQVSVKPNTTGDFALTAKLGELSRTIKLHVETGASSIVGIDSEQTVKSRTYYTTDGIEIAMPSTGTGIVIERTILNDGTVTVKKLAF